MFTEEGRIEFATSLFLLADKAGRPGGRVVGFIIFSSVERCVETFRRHQIGRAHV